MTDEELLAWLDSRIKRYPLNKGLRSVDARLKELLVPAKVNEHFRAENAELRRLLALKEAQLIAMTAQYEEAMRDLFQRDQEAKHYKLAVCYASLWRRLRYAFTGVFR